MKVIIAGGRDINDVNPVLQAIHECGFEITEVVCGGASGVDSIGASIAKGRGIPVKFFPADWGKHGRAAGPIRNRQMAEYGDALILVWDGKSRGSASMKREAQRACLRIFERQIPTH